MTKLEKLSNTGLASTNRKRYGLELNPTYRSWVEMKRRCYDTNRHNYSYYGGRGIKVCDKWLNSFPDFLKDMGEKPSATHSIDRIDNDKDYSPDNCKWSTKQEQALNRRPRSNKSGFKGVYKNGRNWAAEVVRMGKHYRLGTFHTPEEASIAVSEFENAL